MLRPVKLTEEGPARVTVSKRAVLIRLARDPTEVAVDARLLAVGDRQRGVGGFVSASYGLSSFIHQPAPIRNLESRRPPLYRSLSTLL